MPKSSNIVAFPRHLYHRCDCGESGCMYCDGGLAYCVTCGGGEGSLPENCPQERMTSEQEQAVYNGELDYRLKHGGWTTWTRTKEMAVRRLLS